MAAPTNLVITSDLSTTPVLTLTGPAALILSAHAAAALANDDKAEIYLANAEGEYQPAPESHFRQTVLERSMPAFVFEWYGDIKILASRAGLVVGYVKA